MRWIAFEVACPNPGGIVIIDDFTDAILIKKASMRFECKGPLCLWPFLLKPRSEGEILHIHVLLRLCAVFFVEGL